MAIRNIRKNLAGMEDLLIGLGTEEQARGGSTYVMGKVDVPYAVSSQAAMTALDVSVFTRARVYSDTNTFIDYIYDPLATSGIAPNAGAGYWVRAKNATTKSVIAFDTIAEAVAANYLGEGDKLLIKDRANSTWDAVLSSSVTENGYNIVQCTGVGTLSLVLHNQDSTYNSIAYGCKGDGSTDDTAAFRQLVSDLNSNSVVILPPFRYEVDRNGSDVLFDLESLDNVTFIGYGAEIFTTRSIAAGTFHIFNFTNCTNIKVKGIYFNYEVTAVTGATVETAAIAYAPKPTTAADICENIMFSECKFRVKNTSSSGTWYTESLLGVSGPLPEGDTGVTPGYKLDCFYFSGDEVNYYRHKNIVCDNCEFVDMHTRLFWMWCCEDIQFTNNVVHNAGARRPQIRIIVSNRNIKITGNTFYNDNTYSCENTIVLHRQSGSEDYAHAAIVSNNTFYYGKGTAVRIGGFSDVVCDGNVFRLNPLHANSFITNAGADANFKAFKVEITSSNDEKTKNIVISNNTLDAESTYAYLLDGSSTTNGKIVEGVIVEGNTVRDSLGGYSVNAAAWVGNTSGWKNCSFNNNTMINCNGIYLDSVWGVDIKNNTFTSTIGSNYGVYMGDAPKVNVQIQGNTFSNLNRGLDATSSTWPDDYRVYITADTGTFTGTLTGGTSGATGTISSKSADVTWGATAFVVITSASGRFRPGETVTASGGGTGTVLCYAPAAEKIRIMNNTFSDLADVGIRNYVVEGQIIGNVFYNCSAPTQLATGADYVYNVVN